MTRDAIGVEESARRLSRTSPALPRARCRARRLRLTDQTNRRDEHADEDRVTHETSTDVVDEIQ